MPPTDQPREPQTDYERGNRSVGAVAVQIDRVLTGLLRDGADKESQLWPLIYEYGHAAALRERDEAVRLLGEAVNALEWCDSRYRQTLAGKPVRDVSEMRAYIGKTLTDARTLLRRFEGEPG